MNGGQAIRHYAIKRQALLWDEWLWYLSIFICIYNEQYELAAIVFIAGALAITTAYRNIGKVERMLEVKVYGRELKQWFLFPFF